MYKIDLKIETLSPLAIGRQKPGGSISEVKNYIPGSVIRGAIAAKILKQSNQPEPDDDFYDLFLSDRPAIFQNAYPAIAKLDQQAFPEDVLVLPATAVSSKTNPGFNPICSKNNGVFDTLIDRFCAECYDHPYDPNCPKDGGRVEPYTGFYSRIDENYHQHYRQPSISTRLLTRVGINRDRATAEDQVLYSIEVLNEFESNKEKSATYRGRILVEDEELANHLTSFIDSHSFRLGGSTSRGLGKVKITTNKNLVADTVENRINKFNEKLKERWQKWENIFDKPDQDIRQERTYFTLDLQSDAILTEQWRRTTVISEAMLKQFANLDDSSLKLHIAYSSYDYLSGWNSAWGLMKDSELITNQGAVYFFSTTQKESWIKALDNLEIWGVGERNAEGFGQVQVCNDFHLVFRESAV